MASKVPLLTNWLGKGSWNPATRLAGWRGGFRGAGGAWRGPAGVQRPHRSPSPAQTRQGTRRPPGREGTTLEWFLEIAPWESIRWRVKQSALSPFPSNLEVIVQP